ncbi:MAG: S8 family serine peptidase [Spirochaetota bacterium]
MSLFGAGSQITRRTYPNFFSDGGLITTAVERLRAAGFEVLHVTQTTINIAGTQRQFERAFGTKLVIEQREVMKLWQEQAVAEFIEPAEKPMDGLIPTESTDFADLLEGVAIEEPRYAMQPSPFAPVTDYWRLDVPADVSLACNADLAHRSQITGRGVHVAMVDSGWFRHPFFAQRGYRVSSVVLGPGASNPDADESGHGTGESANILSVAPDAQLTPVKMSFVNSVGAFQAAVDLQPDIITCSWGSSRRSSLSAVDQVLAAEVAAAVDAGIVVVFSAGNGHFGFPGQHPDVISAGGVFMDQDGSFRASDYASGFDSEIYTNPRRQVPDLCGLVGMQPRAIYIMLPLEPGDQIDKGNAGGNHPNGDETASNDGWAAFSGTSAAAPQLAGAAALVRQACPELDPDEVRDVLKRSARDVTTGRANPATDQTGTGLGNPAVAGPDNATGHGQVDAHRAVVLAKIRCTPDIPPTRSVRSVAPPPGRLMPPTPRTNRPRHGTSMGRRELTDEERAQLEEMAMRGEIDLSDFGE